MTLRLALTPGEPAGIGPDLAVMLAQQGCDHEVVAFADPSLLQQRAQQLGLPLTPRILTDLKQPAQPLGPGELAIYPIPLAAECIVGTLTTVNAHYVLQALSTATDNCLNGHCNAMITGPIHKGVINDAGTPFSGHTEFLAAQAGVDQVVMMLATEGLRVALATTHLPLANVPGAITEQLLTEVVTILDHDLKQQFGIAKPHILVCGLNPHAGEGGHLGREELDIIEPTLEKLRATGIKLQGPLPADTLFTPKYLENADAVLAMYHDQGLPVLKYKGFGAAVNITLGLPFIRTSVDHGTALDLAGTKKADCGSLQTALKYAINMAEAQAGL